jgi:hypothetical protein
VTGPRVGGRVWVGVPPKEIPGHILSIYPKHPGRVAYSVRTIDLAGRPGENLTLRVYESERTRVLRRRVAGEFVGRLAGEAVGHAPR